MFSFPITFFSSLISQYFKPTSRAGSALTFANAYDGSGTPGTTTTAASLTSPASTTTRYETYSFTGTATYTKFKLYITADWSSYEAMDMWGEYVQGIIGFQYSLNGTLFTEFETVDTIPLSGSYSYTTPLDIGTVTATALDSFKIRIRIKSGMALISDLPDTYDYATASISIKDIYIEASN